MDEDSAGVEALLWAGAEEGEEKEMECRELLKTAMELSRTGLVFFRIASPPSLVSKSVVHTTWIPSLPYLTVFTCVQSQFMVE